MSSFVAGGYVTCRLRRPIEGTTPHEVHVRDGAHWLVVWAIATEERKRDEKSTPFSAAYRLWPIAVAYCVTCGGLRDITKAHIERRERRRLP